MTVKSVVDGESGFFVPSTHRRQKQCSHARLTGFRNISRPREMLMLEIELCSKKL